MVIRRSSVNWEDERGASVYVFANARPIGADRKFDVSPVKMERPPNEQTKSLPLGDGPISILSGTGQRSRWSHIGLRPIQDPQFLHERRQFCSPFLGFLRLVPGVVEFDKTQMGLG